MLIGGAFERLFCPEGREFEQANLQKFKCPGVARGGMLKLQFDWYKIVKQKTSQRCVFDKNCCMSTSFYSLLFSKCRFAKILTKNEQKCLKY